MITHNNNRRTKHEHKTNNNTYTLHIHINTKHTNKQKNKTIKQHKQTTISNNTNIPNIKIQRNDRKPILWINYLLFLKANFKPTTTYLLQTTGSRKQVKAYSTLFLLTNFKSSIPNSLPVSHNNLT